MQDNQLHGNLRVDEAMNVASSLKLPQSVGKNEKEVAVSTNFLNDKIVFYC